MRWVSYRIILLRSCDAQLQVALLRAKEQLKSAMMMNLESKLIVFEDIGR